MNYQQDVPSSPSLVTDPSGSLSHVTVRGVGRGREAVQGAGWGVGGLWAEEGLGGLLLPGQSAKSLPRATLMNAVPAMLRPRRADGGM